MRLGDTGDIWLAMRSIIELVDKRLADVVNEGLRDGACGIFFGEIYPDQPTKWQPPVDNRFWSNFLPEFPSDAADAVL